MFLAPSDEFFVYAERKPNHQSDRIWAYNVDDIPKAIHIRVKTKYPTCIGIFICFTAKAMCWVVKNKGKLGPRLLQGHNFARYGDSIS